MLAPPTVETQKASTVPATNRRATDSRGQLRQPLQLLQRSIGNRAVLKLQLQRKCSDCDEEDERLRRMPTSGARNDTTIPAAVHDTLATSGRPLDVETRAFFEPRFGSDFGDVRVHDDVLADASARSVNAIAYTVGQHVVFRQGTLSPETSDGKRLLAHELTHVVQQRQASPRVAPLDSEPESSAFEREARRSATSVLWGYLGPDYGRVTSDTSAAAATAPAQRPRLSSAHARLQRVELTYDDGPDSAGNTARVLEALKRSDAKATFYVVGHRVAQGDNWRVVFDIAASGNWLGNHAFDWNDAKDNHIFLEGPKEERTKKILDTELAIREALMKGKADAVSNGTWETIPAENRAYIDDVIASGTGRFRTPGFKTKLWRADERINVDAIAAASEAMEAAGLRPLERSDSVSIDPEDWRDEKTAKRKTKEQIEQAVIGKLDEPKDSILLHSRITATAEATPAIVEDIKKRGPDWSFTAPPRGATPPASSRPTQAEFDEAWVSFRAEHEPGKPDGAAAIRLFKMAQRMGPEHVEKLVAMIDNLTVSAKDPEKLRDYLNKSAEFRVFSVFLDSWRAGAVSTAPVAKAGPPPIDRVLLLKRLTTAARALALLMSEADQNGRGRIVVTITRTESDVVPSFSSLDQPGYKKPSNRGPLTPAAALARLEPFLAILVENEGRLTVEAIGGSDGLLNWSSSVSAIIGK
jgi:peptidoglycan/xylan/chitin deacetylase (PgdA/CDA1 family)